jgi:hypothetical protein
MNRNILVFALLSGVSFAQAGFETLLPPQALGETLHIDRDYASVDGHWVPSDEHSKMAGPSVSSISCDRKEGTCEEEQGNITMMGNPFTLSAEHLEYKIERWTAKDIVAARIGGVCRVRSVIKIDIEAKRVLYSEALSEPVDDKLPKMSKNICNLTGMHLELKQSTMFVKK